LRAEFDDDPLLHALQSYRTHQYEQQALAQRLANYTERHEEQAARQREAMEAAKAAAAAASREARLEAIQRIYRRGNELEVRYRQDKQGIKPKLWPGERAPLRVID
jgi:septal ring factor EnvC (AmiA/AmiB activator)